MYEEGCGETCVCIVDRVSLAKKLAATIGSFSVPSEKAILQAFPTAPHPAMVAARAACEKDTMGTVMSWTLRAILLTWESWASQSVCDHSFVKLFASLRKFSGREASLAARRQ